MLDRERKRILGAYLHVFFRDTNLWPEDLFDWCCQTLNGWQPEQGITVRQALDYLAQKTGMGFLTDEYYVNLLGNWSRWSRYPDRGGDSSALVVALAETEVVFLDDVVYNCPLSLTIYLHGGIALPPG